MKPLNSYDPSVMNNFPPANKPAGAANPNTRFWGIWLPVPTILAISTSLFFTWLILSTVGYTEAPIEKAGEPIIEQF